MIQYKVYKQTKKSWILIDKTHNKFIDARFYNLKQAKRICQLTNADIILVDAIKNWFKRKKVKK